MLADGQDVAVVCRELGVFEQTYYWWQNQYGGLKELAEENFSARAGAAPPSLT